MFSKNYTMAPPAVLITPATGCEDGGKCHRMDFILEAQHIRRFLASWGREADKFKPSSPKRLEELRLGSKAAKYIQQFAERDTSSRIVIGGDGSKVEHGEPPLLSELAWWFSETLKWEKPERRVVRYFFTAPTSSDGGSGSDGQSSSDREALDFLYSLIWQLVKAFPHGQTSAQGVVVSAFPNKVSKTLTADEFREQVSRLDGTMATFEAGLDLLSTCVQVAGDRITYIFDGLEPVAQKSNSSSNKSKKQQVPPRGYTPVLRALLASSASKVHSMWVTTKADGPPAVSKFQKDAGRPEKEFSLAPTSSDLLLRSWRSVNELKFKGNRY